MRGWLCRRKSIVPECSRLWTASHNTDVRYPYPWLSCAKPEGSIGSLEKWAVTAFAASGRGIVPVKLHRGNHSRRLTANQLFKYGQWKLHANLYLSEAVRDGLGDDALIRTVNMILLAYALSCAPAIPANTTHLPNDCPMVAHRRWRWANIGQSLGRFVLFAGMIDHQHGTSWAYKAMSQSEYWCSPNAGPIWLMLAGQREPLQIRKTTYKIAHTRTHLKGLIRNNNNWSDNPVVNDQPERYPESCKVSRRALTKIQKRRERLPINKIFYKRATRYTKQQNS